MEIFLMLFDLILDLITQLLLYFFQFLGFCCVLNLFIFNFM